jgi:hypothetical protein
VEEVWLSVARPPAEVSTKGAGANFIYLTTNSTIKFGRRGGGGGGGVASRLKAKLKSETLA